MQFRLFSWLLIGALAGVASLVAQVAPVEIEKPTVVGGAELILVAKYSGRVEMTVGGKVSEVKTNDSVPRSAKINTYKNSSVILVFSNGASTQLGPETELVIEEYLQDPFSSSVRVAEINDEPSQSHTRLSLNKGELVGNVKTLKYDKGSRFIVQTPVGAAGIRGTTFRIVFVPGGTGQAFFTLSTASGRVNFVATDGSGASGGGATPAGNTPAPVGPSPATPPPSATGVGTVSGISVPQGQEIAITVNVTTNAQGAMVVTAVPSLPASTIPISTVNLQQVVAAASQISVAVEKAVFTPPPPSPPATGGSPGTSTPAPETPSTPGGSTGAGTGTQSGGNAGGTTGTIGSVTSSTTTVSGQNFTAQVTTTPAPAATPARIVTTQP